MRKLLILILGLSLPIYSFSQDIQWASKIVEYSSELTPIQYSAEQVLGKPTVLPAAGKAAKVTFAASAIAMASSFNIA